jgi:Fe-Mn family superoxide dismutase
MAPLDATSKIFELPPLPFADTALEPTISARTLSFHHGKHHKAYVEKANKLIQGTDLAQKSPEEIVRATAKDESKTEIFNNAAQAWNHTFYWQCLSPTPTKPDTNLSAAIDKAFGGLDPLKDQLRETGMKQFGSGWAWLVVDGGKLAVIKTANADTPIAHHQTPLLTLDVWEHAYYLDYQNERERHLKTVLDKIVNWDFASKNFAAAAK